MSALQAEIQDAVLRATRPMEDRLIAMHALLEQSLQQNEDPYLTVAEAAKLSRHCEATIRRKARSGLWEIKRDGRKILILRASFLSAQS